MDKRRALWLVVAIVAVGSVAWRHELTAECAELACLAAVLVHLSREDARRRVIPNSDIALALGIRLAYVGLCVPMPVPTLARDIVAGIAVAAPLALTAAVLGRLRGRSELGGGDVKLLFVIGCHFGWLRGLAVVSAACLASMAFVLVRALLLRRRLSAETTFPLGPFLSLASWVAILLE